MKVTPSVAIILASACTACVATPGYRFPGVGGQILDNMTNAPIAGATVNMTPFGGSGVVLFASSDANGRFEVRQGTTRFRSWPPPAAIEGWVDAHLDISADGYEAQRLTLLDLQKGKLPDIAVQLMRR